MVEKIIGYKVRRITLGRYADLTVEQARKEAEKLLGKIATGSNPIAEKQTIKVRKVTLQDVFKDYKHARKNLKPKTFIQFTVHDLRRTVITIAESPDISAYSLKRLLNHKMDSNDVTAGYIITDVERLRKPMEQFGEFIMAKCLNS